MMKSGPDPGLEFLLAFDGRIHYLERGYWLKFEIRRVAPSKLRPHGIAYSFTMHAPDGRRLLGFDNAHAVKRGKHRLPSAAVGDHWHRTEKDRGQPYAFTSAEVLLDDFFNEVERIASTRGIGTEVVSISEPGKKEPR